MYPQDTCRFSGTTLELLYDVSGIYQVYQTERNDLMRFKILGFTKRKHRKAALEQEESFSFPLKTTCAVRTSKKTTEKGGKDSMNSTNLKMFSNTLV